MSKRAAERQLTKDDEEIGGGDEQIERGMKKADAATLAARPMRGMPKRMSGIGSPSTASSLKTKAPETSPSKFGGFAGFGGPSTSNGFTATPPATPGSLAPALDSTWTSTPSTPPPGATKTARALGSLLADSALPASPAPAPVTQSNSDEPAETYLKAVWGLNTSFVDAVKAQTDKAPFSDISPLFDTYKKHLMIYKANRQTSEAALKATPKSAMSFSAGFGGAPTTNSGSKPSPFGMPPAPATGNSSKDASSKGFVFNPTTATKSSGNLFGFPASSTTTSKPAESLFKPLDTPVIKPVELPATTSLFGGNTTSAAPTTSTSLFGAPPSTGPSTSLFGAPPSPGKSLFGAAPAAGNDAAKSNPFGFTPTSTKESNPSSSPFQFGAAAKVTAPTTSAFSFGTKPDTTVSSKPDAAPSSFFSTPPSGALSGFGGFGKPATPSSNPLGFGFGTAPEKKESAEPEPSSSQSTEPTSEASNPLRGSNPNDEEGEGEENETTTHSVKLKAYRLKVEPERGWADLGVGFVRLKKDKSSENRRMLMRNSGSGKIIINFALYSGLHPTLNGKAVSFVGHDNGQAVSYSVRMKTEEQARDLLEAMEREIATLQPKD